MAEVKPAFFYSKQDATINKYSAFSDSTSTIKIRTVYPYSEITQQDMKMERPRTRTFRMPKIYSQKLASLFTHTYRHIYRHLY